MVIKGSARGGAGALAAHLQRTDTNERTELTEVRGVVAQDLEGALHEIEAVATGARSKRPFYHASLSTRADELLTPEQWTQAIDRLENELGLDGQPRVVVAHLKKGRAHVHVAWSRIELTTMKAISDSHNYRRHEIVARELERVFGHARVQGAHIEREGQERPGRTPTHAEMQQAERTGRTPEQAKRELTEIWNRTDSGRAFAAAIAGQGWILARGDKRDFVLVDFGGEVHSLARRVEGAKAKDVRARMTDVDTSRLPSVKDAKAQQREHARAHDLQADGRTYSDRAPAESAPLSEPPRIAPPTIEPALRSRPPLPSQQATDEEKKRRREQAHPAIATSNASMAAQQQEAQRRFEANSKQLQRQDRLKLLGQATPREDNKPEERGTFDRSRPRGGREL